MRELYIECNMGAAGDMLAAALLELLTEEAARAFLEEFAALSLPGVTLEREDAVKCGIHGTHLTVRVDGAEEASEDVAHDHGHTHGYEAHPSHGHEVHDHEEHTHHEHEHHHHHHTSLQDIERLVGGFALPTEVRQDILAVYHRIAEAEAAVHRSSIDAIHFHEVGTMDAVADVTAVCMLLHRIGAERITASPIHLGSGNVRCAHGILPVPAPATAYLLRGVPSYGGAIEGELCTPTGAALLRHFAEDYGAQPVMRTERIGYGMGKKDFPRANCVRAFLGESAARQDEVVELCCNLDDMTGEELAFACERLLESGARDVYTVAIGMKKGRPGTMLCVLADDATAEALRSAIYRYTTTLGIRERRLTRTLLEREISEENGVRVKTARGYGVCRSKTEYEDLARVARERGGSLREAAAYLSGSKTKG